MKDKSKKQKLDKPTKKNISVRHQYSGDKSNDFWSIIESIKNNADRQELYSLGVALQNMEEYVLKQLQHVKKSYVRGKK
jgi:hypothetical protein